MNQSRFWDIILQSRSEFDPNRFDGNMDLQVEKLKSILEKFSNQEILEFNEQFVEYLIKLYRWDLWGAAYIIGQGCSDDSFKDFRSWLISLGKSDYNKVLDSPDYLIEIYNRPGIEDIFFEEFAYISNEVYNKKNNADLPSLLDKYPENPLGTKWKKEKDLKKMFPKLWEHFR